MFTSYEIGRLKTFLHPLVVVIVVVLVMTVDDAFLVTSVDSLDVVLVISNTLSGARSRGLNTVLTPDSGSQVTITPSRSDLSPSSDVLLLPDVRLDTDDTFVGIVDDDISYAINAARTSGERLVHASRMDAGNKGLGSPDASSLQNNTGEYYWREK